LQKEISFSDIEPRPVPGKWLQQVADF